MSFLANNIEFILFIVFLSVFLFWKRKNLEIQGTPIFYIMMYRTSLGLEKMKSWSKKHPRLFHTLSHLSYIVGVYGMILMIILSVWSLFIIFDQNLSTGGGLVLPIQAGETNEMGISETAVPIMYVPFWYWIIAIFILAIVHEFAHGVIAQRYDIPVKSSGFAFLGILAPILPAAFVEPDEEIMKKKSRWKQIAMLGAGSTSNFIFGILFFLIFAFVTTPFAANTTQINNIEFSSVMNESSLNNYNLSSGNLVSFNGVENKEEIINQELQNLEINKTYQAEIESNNETQNVNITTFANPQDSSRAMIGITGLQYTNENIEGYQWLGDFPQHLNQLLFYIWFLNIGIGMMNLLPLWITDGGRISLLLFESRISKDRARFWNNLVSTLILLLIIVSVWPNLLSPIFG